MARTFLSLAVSAALVFALPARAAPPQGAPAGSAAPPPEEDPALAERDRKDQAQAHFDKGVMLIAQRAWEAALAESQLSRELYPTKSATYNIAFCLKNLQRFDEALEMFEVLLREFPNLPPDEKTEAQRDIDELRAVVGTVEITGAKPGASIVIDGRARGDYPPVTPIRVSAGTHTVRVFKAGYRAFEKRVDVIGGRTVSVPAPLLVLTEAGRLKVTEKTGKEIDVLVDSIVVGKTPWEGMLSAGDHVVVLRGEGSMGTPPASAPVKARQLSTLSLSAEELEATLRVDPTPAEASVIIDAVSVGRGTWQGALRSGAHRVEVRYEGYLPVKRQVTLVRGQQDRLALTLERDPEAEIWKKPPKITFDAGVGLAVVPSLGGDVASGCVNPCSRSIGLGGLGLFHAGYEFGSGFSIGGAAGYLIAAQGTEGRGERSAPAQRPGSGRDGGLPEGRELPCAGPARRGGGAGLRPGPARRFLHDRHERAVHDLPRDELTLCGVRLPRP
jgi:hypothetical protein